MPHSNSHTKTTLSREVHFPLLIKYIFIVIAVASLIIGCGNQLSQAIVGKWTTSNCLALNNMKQMEFFSDNTFSDGTYSGKYSFPDDSHITLDYEVVSRTYTISISDNTMTLSDLKGNSCSFERTT